ncbi:MAG: hypothetical protein ACHP9Y_04830, partial [Gammaproteobacteria bacterium]
VEGKQNTFEKISEFYRHLETIASNPSKHNPIEVREAEKMIEEISDSYLDYVKILQQVQDGRIAPAPQETCHPQLSM